MSTQTNISVSDELLAAFKNAQRENTRLLHIVVDGGIGFFLLC